MHYLSTADRVVQDVLFGEPRARARVICPKLPSAELLFLSGNGLVDELNALPGRLRLFGSGVDVIVPPDSKAEDGCTTITFEGASKVLVLKLACIWTIFSLTVNCRIYGSVAWVTAVGGEKALGAKGIGIH